MNVHEYQAKQLFAEAGVAVPKIAVAQSANQFDQALSSFSTDQSVVVTQIHAGGRGKAFTNGFKGELHVVPRPLKPKKKPKLCSGMYWLPSRPRKR